MEPALSFTDFLDFLNDINSDITFVQVHKDAPLGYQRVARHMAHGSDVVKNPEYLHNHQVHFVCYYRLGVDFIICQAKCNRVVAPTHTSLWNIVEWK